MEKIGRRLHQAKTYPMKSPEKRNKHLFQTGLWTISTCLPCIVSFFCIYCKIMSLNWMRYNTIKDYRYVKTKHWLSRQNWKLYITESIQLYIYCTLSQDIYASHFLKSFWHSEIPRNGIKCHDIYLLEWKKSQNSSFETVHLFYHAY